MAIGNLRTLMAGVAALGMTTGSSMAEENANCRQFDNQLQVTASIQGDQITLNEVNGLSRSWERTLLPTERALPTDPTTVFFIKEAHLNGELVDLARDPVTGKLNDASWIPLGIKDPSADYCLGLGSTNIPTATGLALTR